jgi:DNA-binding transcriptional LysR family regulator
LLHHARQMLFNVEKMGLELGEHSHGVRGYVRMLANLSAIIQFLPEDLRDFSALHPQVKADLEERPSNGVMRFLQSRGDSVIPVNPGLAGQILNGQLVYAILNDIPQDKVGGMNTPCILHDTVQNKRIRIMDRGNLSA